MKRTSFLQHLFFVFISPNLLKQYPMASKPSPAGIRLLRHATLIITIGNKKLLVDPMLSAKDAMDPVANCGNDIRIPMTDFPITGEALNELLRQTDAVVITHTHRDHWDAAAQQLIDKDKPIFCQPSDLEKIKSQGFQQVTAIGSSLQWEGIAISRTGGRHGTGEIGKKMGEVSGFVFSHAHHSIYLAGDTIWCDEVKEALDKYHPAYTIVNAGAAKFLTGDPITMTPEDILRVHEQLPSTKIIAVHMDTVNHCFVKRIGLKREMAGIDWQQNLLIPDDGALIEMT